MLSATSDVILCVTFPPNSSCNVRYDWPMALALWPYLLLTGREQLLKTTLAANASTPATSSVSGSCAYKTMHVARWSVGKRVVCSSAAAPLSTDRVRASLQFFLWSSITYLAIELSQTLYNGASWHYKGSSKYCPYIRYYPGKSTRHNSISMKLYIWPAYTDWVPWYALWNTTDWCAVPNQYYRYYNTKMYFSGALSRREK